MQPITGQPTDFEQPKPMKHRKTKKDSDGKKSLAQRVMELESLHPELKQKEPTPLWKTIGKWSLCIIIIGIFLYGIYLFVYWYEYLGKDVTIPFIGVLRH